MNPLHSYNNYLYKISFASDYLIVTVVMSSATLGKYAMF